MDKFLADFIEKNEKNLKLINTPNYRGKKKVRVAIIDGSPYIKLAPWVTRVNYKEDRHYHGTLGAFIIKSIALDNAEIFGIGVLYNEESDWGFDEALNWCIDNNIQIVNVSMSLGRTQKRTDIINKAAAKGIKIIKSAGNEGSDGITYPGELDNVITIGALSNTDPEKRASYSSVGEDIEVVFPGTWWGYTLHNDVSRIRMIPINGTSFAAPACTGVLAVFHSWFYDKYDRWPTIQECRGFLRQNAKDIEDPGKDDESGYGRFIWPDQIKFDVHNEIKLKINSKKYYINDEEFLMDVAPFIKNSRTFVPIRFVAEAMGFKVSWHPPDTVIIEEPERELR